MTSTRDDLNAFLDYPQIEVPHAATGPLAGLTLGVKDIFDVAYHPTGGGNPQFPGASKPATATAPSVQKLLDAGAAYVGKTQTEELTFSLIGQNVHFPHPVNPKARDRVTGGSSSGSAAAVAAWPVRHRDGIGHRRLRARPGQLLRPDRPARDAWPALARKDDAARPQPRRFRLVCQGRRDL